MNRDRAIDLCRMIWSQVAEDLREMDLKELKKITSAYDLKQGAINTLCYDDEHITEHEREQLQEHFNCSLCHLTYHDCLECPGYELWLQASERDEVGDSPCETVPGSPYREIHKRLTYCGLIDEAERLKMIEAAEEMGNYTYGR